MPGSKIPCVYFYDSVKFQAKFNQTGFSRAVPVVKFWQLYVDTSERLVVRMIFIIYQELISVN